MAVIAAPQPQSVSATYAPSRQPVDRDQEDFDWATATYPEPLGALHLGTPQLADLLAWASDAGPVELYLRGPGADCSPTITTLQRHGGDVSGLSLKIIRNQHTTGGLAQRDYTTGSVASGGWLSVGDGFGSEQRRGADWVLVAGHARLSGPSWVSLLTGLDPEVARFEGEPVHASIRCDGPFESMRCSDGGTQPCDSCRKLSFELYSAFQPFSRTPLLKQPTPCGLPCPPRASPDLSRLRSLFERVTPWRSAPEAYALYRDLGRCKSGR